MNAYPTPAALSSDEEDGRNVAPAGGALEGEAMASGSMADALRLMRQKGYKKVRERLTLEEDALSQHPKHDRGQWKMSQPKPAFGHVCSIVLGAA